MERPEPSENEEAHEETHERERSRAGLCATCVHAHRITTRRSTFYRCLRADEEPEFSRYPQLPVVACHGWEHRR